MSGADGEGANCILAHSNTMTPPIVLVGLDSPLHPHHRKPAKRIGKGERKRNKARRWARMI